MITGNVFMLLFVLVNNTCASCFHIKKKINKAKFSFLNGKNSDSDMLTHTMWALDIS